MGTNRVVLTNRNGHNVDQEPDPEVVPTAEWRKSSVEYKLCILPRRIGSRLAAWSSPPPSFTRKMSKWLPPTPESAGRHTGEQYR